MTPICNLSILPWYSSIAEQNARKWWIYDKVYPLFTPVGYLPPFQIRRNALNQKAVIIESRGGYLPEQNVGDPITYGIAAESNSIIAYFEIPAGATALNYENIPAQHASMGGSTGQSFVFIRHNIAQQEVAGQYAVPYDGQLHSGTLEIPAGSEGVWVNIFCGPTSPTTGDIEFNNGLSSVIKKATIYTPDGTEVQDITQNFRDAIQFYPDGPIATRQFDTLVYSGLLPIFPNAQIGQYYIMLQDEANTWYSEIFTVVDNILPYLKITWWDNQDFETDAGTIIYRDGFKNVIYLRADLAKPEYIFTEEGQERDGYFFPQKQISEKKYKFSFWASEYLLDVMRFIRMADHVKITYAGQTYNVDSFLITPEWEKNGDIAGVSAEFETATVAKKIGNGYTIGAHGDFNNDFNNDFYNQ